MEAGRKLAARHPHGRSRTAHNMSSSSLRKKSDAALVRKVPVAPLRPLLANLQEVFLATKLAVLFPAVPLTIAAQCFRFDQVNSIPHSIPFHVRFDHPLVCLVFVASFFFSSFFFRVRRLQAAVTRWQAAAAPILSFFLTSINRDIVL